MLLLIIYLSFIGLGLPDTLLGSGWPVMYSELGVPVSYAGVLTMLCGVGTVTSTMLSQHLIARFGTGKVTACSTGLTACGLLCFSLCGEFWMLMLCMIPLGVGAGCVDAALNNYVAVHYESRHMSWLHCMWGVGTIVGPYVMGAALSAGMSWRMGYRSVGVLQAALCGVLVLGLPLWNRNKSQQATETETETEALPMKVILKIPRVKAAALCFFCYCGLEQTAGLWASSYLHLARGVPVDTAAKFAALYFLGITAGRGMNGFLTLRFTDKQLITGGLGLVLLGVGCILLPVGETAALFGFVIMGLGSAPVYPCLVHGTPEHFGADKSQAVIGVQMAGAFLGSSLLPPLFGLLANHVDIRLLPVYLLALLGGLGMAHRRLQN